MVLHCAVKAVVLFDNGVKAALVVAACAFLMLKTGFLECGFLIYYPLVVVLGVVGRNNVALIYDCPTACAYGITGITFVGAIRIKLAIHPCFTCMVGGIFLGDNLFDFICAGFI